VREQLPGGRRESATARQPAAVGPEDDAVSDLEGHGAQLVERPFWGHVPENTAVPLDKAAWLTTVIACLIAVVILLIAGYIGYAATAFCVAAAAAINLR
jgi:hypothetical protein